MALLALSLAEVIAMNAAQRTEYFLTYAGCFDDAPVKKYAIRVGSHALYDADTYDLRMQFEEYVRRERRNAARRKGRVRK